MGWWASVTQGMSVHQGFHFCPNERSASWAHRIWMPPCSRSLQNNLVCSPRGVRRQKCFSLKISGTLLPGSGGCPPGNVYNLKINLVQSWAKKTLFDKISGCTYMSFSLNECEFPWNGTSLFPEISELPEKWQPCWHFAHWFLCWLPSETISQQKSATELLLLTISVRTR